MIRYKSLVYDTVDCIDDKWRPCIVTEYVDSQSYGEELMRFDPEEPPSNKEVLRHMVRLDPERKRQVYVAGKFTGKSSWEIEQNVRRAEELALEIWRDGRAYAYCPHTSTRFFFGAGDEILFINGHMEALRRSDVVLMVPGWRDSRGSLLEKEEAVLLGIPVFESLEDLRAWLDEV